MKKFVIIFLIALFSMSIFAHGVSLKYDIKKTIDIYVSFDTGSPLAEAQIEIYNEENPETPFLNALCDKNGFYSFVPDSNIPGPYTIKVRKAGHGTMAFIDSGSKSGGSNVYNPLQKIVMILSVSWGFIGTALYFKRAKK